MKRTLCHRELLNRRYLNFLYGRHSNPNAVIRSTLLYEGIVEGLNYPTVEKSWAIGMLEYLEKVGIISNNALNAS